MTRSSRRRLVFAALTGLALLAPAVPAHADEEWHSPPCATGELTASFVEPGQTGSDVFIRLEGWSALCEPTLGTQQPYEFGLILYAETEGWVGRLSEYVSPTGPTPFAYRVNHTQERRHGPIVAACLGYDQYRRLSCVAVDFTHQPFVVPISVDDPRVAGKHVEGICAECASDPGED